MHAFADHSWRAIIVAPPVLVAPSSKPPTTKNFQPSQIHNSRVHHPDLQGSHLFVYGIVKVTKIITTQATRCTQSKEEDQSSIILPAIHTQSPNPQYFFWSYDPMSIVIPPRICCDPTQHLQSKLAIVGEHIPTQQRGIIQLEPYVYYYFTVPTHFLRTHFKHTTVV